MSVKNKVFIIMKLNSKNYLHFAIVIMSVFFFVKTLVLLEIWESTKVTRATEYICFLIFIPLFWIINRNYVKSQKSKVEQSDKFLSTAAIISMTDKRGKIIFVNEQPFASTTVKEYVPAVNPLIWICCGSLGTLSDQLKLNGGSPEEINAVIFPLDPLPQEWVQKCIGLQGGGCYT